MTDAVFGAIILILSGVSGVIARYLFVKITRSSERHDLEFVRVDKELAQIRNDLKMHCLEMKLKLEHEEANTKHLSDKVYSHGDKLAVLISRLERIEFKLGKE